MFRFPPLRPLGNYDRLFIAMFHTGALVLLVAASFMGGRGIRYYAGLVVAGVLAAHQQWRIRTREPQACFRAFLDNNRFGAVIFLRLMLDYYG